LQLGGQYAIFLTPRIVIGDRFRFLDFLRQSHSGYFDPNNYVANRVFSSLYYEHRFFYTYLEGISAISGSSVTERTARNLFTAAPVLSALSRQRMSPSSSTSKVATSPLVRRLVSAILPSARVFSLQILNLSRCVAGFDVRALRVFVRLPAESVAG
jgi:hypothetical protein